MAGVNGGAVPRSPASYVHRATARAVRRDVMCRAGGDPLQVVLCGRQRGQVAWLCGARVLVARRGGRHAGAVACAGARVMARVRGRAEAVCSGRAHARGRCGAGAQACGRGAAWPSRLGTPSAVCAGGAARPGRRAFTRPSGCCVPGWGAWPCGECEGEPDRAWSAGRLGVARLLRSAREEEGRARPALEWPSGERERGRGGPGQPEQSGPSGEG